MSKSNQKSLSQKTDNSKRVCTEACDPDDAFDIQSLMKKYKINFYDFAQQPTNIKKLPTAARKSNGTSVERKKLTTSTNFTNIINNASKPIISSVDKKEDKKQYQQQQMGQQFQMHQSEQLQKANKTQNSQQFCERQSNQRLRTEPSNIDPSQYTYQIDKVVGSGSFGTVYKAKIRENGQIVAIKKVLQDKRYKNRELQILKELNHPNVLKMIHFYYNQGENPQEIYLNIIMPFYPETIHSLNKKYIKQQQCIPNILVKLYAYQMLRSLVYISSISICHRDIKPHNILVDPNTNRIVMCDFGSAKKLIQGESNISYICSRCYRAPELIFGATDYSAQIDVWSVGCVIAEMINGEPLFLGNSAVDQLVEIIKVLGTPTKDQVLEMNQNYNLKDYTFPQIKAREWKKVLRSSCEPLGVDLIQQLLVFSPKERLTPIQALAHPYFDELRDESKLRILAQKIMLPNLFDFQQAEINNCTEQQIQILVPLWYLDKIGQN